MGRPLGSITKYIWALILYIFVHISVMAVAYAVAAAKINSHRRRRKLKWPWSPLKVTNNNNWTSWKTITISRYSHIINWWNELTTTRVIWLLQSEWIRQNCAVQMERVRDNYKGQVQHIRDFKQYGSSQISAVREQYFEQVRLLIHKADP